MQRFDGQQISIRSFPSQSAAEDGSLQSYRQYVQGLPLSEPPEEGNLPETTRHWNESSNGRVYVYQRGTIPKPCWCVNYHWTRYVGRWITLIWGILMYSLHFCTVHALVVMNGFRTLGLPIIFRFIWFRPLGNTPTRRFHRLWRTRMFWCRPWLKSVAEAVFVLGAMAPGDSWWKWF